MPTMPKIYLKPSSRPHRYPNGGDEAYWMHRIAAAVKKELAALSVDCVLGGEPQDDCGLRLTLRTHAAPEEMEAKLKGVEVFYYSYSPAAKRAAEVFTACLKEVYPEPQLVEAAPTPAREELREARVPALLVELGYHDNPQDEAWLVNGVEPISAGLAKAAAGFLGVEGS